MSVGSAVVNRGVSVQLMKKAASEQRHRRGKGGSKMVSGGDGFSRA